MTIRLTDVHFDKLSRRELPARFVAVMTTAVLLAGGSANAADQGLTGKKLLLTSAPKLLVLSKTRASASRARIRSRARILQ
jgi:hypothetical protein